MQLHQADLEERENAGARFRFNAKQFEAALETFGRSHDAIVGSTVSVDARFCCCFSVSARL